MFGRIIVATDLTPATRLSLRAACEVRHSQGEILLVHVIRSIAGVSDDDLSSFYGRLRTTAAARMRELSSAFARERHLDIPSLVAVGDPAREIERIARERDAGRFARKTSCCVVVVPRPVLALRPAIRPGQRRDGPHTLGCAAWQSAQRARICP
jgi:hypothetical protein